MIKREITPISQLGSRPPEAGRIRLGVKVPAEGSKKSTMKSIDTLRFTSPNADIIHAIANVYGGSARPWNDKSANPPNQFEVITTSNTVRVMLVPEGLSTWYELWSAGGCQRRCDGVTCATPEKVGYDYELVDCPCICAADGKRSCEVHTRINMVLPEFNFIGVWRLETKGWNAAEELPGMFDLIVACAQAGKLVDADLSVERREKVIPGLPKRSFVVPRLTVRSSILELASGGGTLAIAPPSSAVQHTVPALTIGGDYESVPANPFTDEPIDAEIIDDELLDIEADLRKDALNFGLDPDAYVQCVKASKPDDRPAWRNCSKRVRAGEIEPMAIASGRIQWKVNP